MTEQLKPCPFCGGPAMVYQPINSEVWHASCRTQDACYALLNDFASEDEAASEWNRRVTEVKPLRACPFCGRKAKVYQASTNVWRVMCDEVNCGALLSDFKSPEEAIAAWNRRVLSEEDLKAANNAFRRRCVDARA